MKIERIQEILNHRINGRWEWHVYLWLKPNFTADAVLKSYFDFETKSACVRDKNKLLSELGIMNKNTRRRKAETPGAHQPRKSRKPKVGASAAEITRRIAKERS